MNSQELVEKIKQILPTEQIKIDEALSRHTTFRVGGPADIMVMPDCEHIADVIGLCQDQQVPYTVMGNGSNLLVSDNGIRGVVIKFGKNAQAFNIEGTRVTVDAGTLLGKTANEAAGHGLHGMEFAAGIPGSIGGAVVMNAGAYGGEMSQIIQSVTVLTPEGTLLELGRDELELGYRHSCITEKGYIVLRVVLELEVENPEAIFAQMEEYKKSRIEKQPLNYPSAGSTFKRPEGYFAGKLIQDAGLRGYTVGGAQVSEKHCGFVVNIGDATASDIVTLMNDVKKIVLEKYKVTLEPEVKLVGDF